MLSSPGGTISDSPAAVSSRRLATKLDACSRGALGEGAAPDCVGVDLDRKKKHEIKDIRVTQDKHHFLFFFHPTRMAALVWALLLLPCCEALVVIEHASHQRHRPPPGMPHAEVPARLEAAKAALKGSSFASSLRWRTTAEVVLRKRMRDRWRWRRSKKSGGGSEKDLPFGGSFSEPPPLFLRIFQPTPAWGTSSNVTGPQSLLNIRV